MARHRKIPAKKHHGVKDPEQQRLARESKLHAKVNSAPSAKFCDDQEVPRKLQRITEARQDLAESGGSAGRPQKRKKDNGLLDSTKHMGFEMRLPGMKRALKPVPVFKQEPGENQKQFYYRMHQQVQEVLKRKKYEDKYDVELVRDQETGKEEIKEREKDEVDQQLWKLKAKKLLKKKGIVMKTKEEKRKIRRLQEAEKRLKKKRRLRKLISDMGEDSDHDDYKEFDDMRDNVMFNEVASAPPTLKSAPKRSEAALAAAAGLPAVARRPGKNRELLLAEKLQGKSSKKKRKETTSAPAHKMRMEEERERVIEQYRSMKMGRMSKVKM